MTDHQADMYQKEEKGVPATFQVIYFVSEISAITAHRRQIGWKPGPKQPKPLERGAGQTNLKDVL